MPPAAAAKVFQKLGHRNLPPENVPGLMFCRTYFGKYCTLSLFPFFQLCCLYFASSKTEIAHRKLL